MISVEKVWYLSCVYGLLPTLRLLNLFICNEIDYLDSFVIACRYGNLTTAKWLQTKFLINYSSLQYEYIFKEACIHGHLEIAKWLLTVNPTIDVAVGNYFAFQMACSKGYLEVAQWLLSVKPTINISAANDFAFRWACECKHLQVAEWLVSLKPWKYKITYQIFTDDYKKWFGEIKSTKEEKWYFQRYPLWLMSSISPNRNNIFYKLPLDISKDILLHWL